MAIKKITNAFENLVDARRTLREMKLLRYLKCGRAAQGSPAPPRTPRRLPAALPQCCPPRKPLPLPPRHPRHENVIALRDVLRPASRDATDVYLVYELMDTDLHQIIRSSQPLSDDHFQYFVYQVCR